MSLFKKAKKRHGQTPTPKEDTYRYDFPREMRVQVGHILMHAVGDDYRPRDRGNEYWSMIYDFYVKEVAEIVLGPGLSHAAACLDRFHETTDNEEVRTFIAAAFLVIDKYIRRDWVRWGTHYDGILPIDYPPSYNIKQKPDDAIAELNYWFGRYKIGYEYIGGDVHRIDSAFAHGEVVKPALSLLRQPGFQGPEQEFLKAYEHFTNGRYAEAITTANHAFESTMKAIATDRKWPFDSTAGASALIKVMFDNELIPPHVNSHFGALKSTLECGLPTVRNKTGGAGHGQGSIPVKIERFVAAYALHLAATNIVFLVSAHDEMPK